MANLDIYNEVGVKVADNKPSPVTVGGLTPNTTYTGWKIAYAGAEAKADIPEFKTLPRKLDSFKVDKTAITGKVGEVATIKTSDYVPADATDKVLTAFSDDPNVATLTDNHDTTYKLTFLKAGTTKLHLTANGGDAHAEIAVTVTAPAPAPIKLASFKIDKAEINGKVGEETTVTASDFLPADTTDQTLKFFTENGGIATITYDHGTTYAVKLLNPGTTKLHFNANDNGGAHAEVTVNVTAATPAPAPASSAAPAPAH